MEGMSSIRIIKVANIKDKSTYFSYKRFIDIIIVSLSMIVLAPFLLLIAILIKLDSSGPVIFTQKRIGAKQWVRDDSFFWKQTPFTFYKFRTMKVDATPDLHHQFVKAYINGDEAQLAKLRSERIVIAKYKLTNDPRVTKLGQFLRKTSLDELPQLWNVFKGEMTLVGPRPPIPYEVEMYKPWHHQRLATIPGITGQWQVKGRSSTTFDEMVRLDLDYIDKQSVGYDFKILFATIPAVISKKGAG